MDKKLRLSRRLDKVASFIAKGTVFADIGSDHAYLPCYVCLHDNSTYAVAGEVHDGPYQSARETVNRYGLSDRVDVRLGDGLQVLRHGEVTAIVIAGMGGSLITSILEGGLDRLDAIEQIIAQPNIDERSVRYWLINHGYSILNEAMVEEKGHIYEIIIGTKKGGVNDLTERQMLFGPYLLSKKPELFYRKWKHEYTKRERIIEQMKKATVPEEAKITAFSDELTWIEEVLNDDNDYA
ncbi:SAM-dependent methyltransferase [Lentibacillus kapialis]|uniref:SAM-dependent methyltransferase n=1 Tax=Lentibacillus kapialis TaxID=340214 RepID=A0A917UT18_9BACI|nr:class I SAM-dependent methyltransferase [Lentibacillus kapialis]GGJ83240.1 SAM-dependent methyltransferase [Lentibacillus kapialis]